MLARSLASAALLLTVGLELIASGPASAAENGRPQTDETATTVKDDVARPAAENQVPADSPPAVPRKTRVLFITARDCEQCAQELVKLRKPGGDFEAMQSRGWKIGEGPENHLQIVDREAIADLVAQLDVREYPTVACISNGEI